MSPSQQPPVPERRRFLKAAGLAGLGSAIGPSLVAMAQSATPPGTAPAKPDSVAAPAPAGPPPISDDARALAEIIRRRYGAHLNDQQLEAVTREINGRLTGGKALRDVKLANGDEPDFTFHV